SIAGVSAGRAAEPRLALARLRIHVPARRAPLARKRRTDLLHPAGRLLLQTAYQQAPPGSQDPSVQLGLDLDVTARVLPGAFRGSRHIPDPQVFDPDQIESASNIRRRFLGPVLAPVGLPGLQPRQSDPRPL